MAFGFNPANFAARSGFGATNLPGLALSIFGPKGSTTAFDNAGQNPKPGRVPIGAASEKVIRNLRIISVKDRIGA